MSTQKAQHTPGPWIREGTTVYSLVVCGWKKGVEQFANRFYLSVQRGNGSTQEELEANARLIAAGPELLKTLQYAVKHLERLDPGNTVLNEARAAIAKANGEQ